MKLEGFFVRAVISRYLIAAAAIGAAVIVPATALASVGIPLPGMGLAATQASYVPAQFIAKLYTEALGRIPDQGGWQSAVTHFAQNGCGSSSLAAYGEAVFWRSEE